MNFHLAQIYRAAGMAVADRGGGFLDHDFETLVSVDGVARCR